MHSFKGEGAAAVHSANRALKLSPLDPVRYFYELLAASAAVAAGQYEEGLALAQRSWRANRRFASSLRAIVIAQVLLGRLSDARQSARALLQLEPTLTASGYLRRHPAAPTRSAECGPNRFVPQVFPAEPGAKGDRRTTGPHGRRTIVGNRPKAFLRVPCVTGSSQSPHPAAVEHAGAIARGELEIVFHRGAAALAANATCVPGRVSGNA